MTEEEWARERATVINDDPPRFGDGRVEFTFAVQQGTPLPVRAQ